MRYFILMLFIPIYTQVHSQCDGNPLEYLNANGEKFTYRKLDSMNLIQFYYLNDTLLLDFLYDPSFTIKVQNPFDYPLIARNNIQNRQSMEISTGWPIDICTTCYSKEIKIIDTIDVNNDGVKELFLYREWSCTAPYHHNIPHNPQKQYQSLGQYEVWDIKSNTRIFKLKNLCTSGVPVTANTGSTVGYHFDVVIRENGSFFVPKWKENESLDDSNSKEIREVIFEYNNETEEYEMK